MTTSRIADDFRPTAALPTLRLRAALLNEIRRFFTDRDYLEVETPLLSRDSVLDAHIDPFACDVSVGGRSESWYLQTSPEFHMKRLLASGLGAIFQISKVFRRGEAGERHNPEFTMVEWYRIGDTHHDQMDVVEALVRAVLRRARGFWQAESTEPSLRGVELGGVEVGGVETAQPAALAWADDAAPWPRRTYDELFETTTGERVLTKTAPELAALADRWNVPVPRGLPPGDRDGWLNLLLACVVEPRLAEARPTFVYDYPASQSALAKVRDEDPPVAERFELYFQGVELCNGYHELTDADELRRRNARQAASRADRGERPLPRDSRLLDAMDAGLPECAGVALGFDRLVMLAAGWSSIADVLTFPFDRA